MFVSLLNFEEYLEYENRLHNDNQIKINFVHAINILSVLQQNIQLEMNYKSVLQDRKRKFEYNTMDTKIICSLNITQVNHITDFIKSCNFVTQNRTRLFLVDPN
jgi:hypothetical protein